MEGNCYLAAATMLDLKLSFRDHSVAQQGIQWLIQEMSTLSLQPVSDVHNETARPITNYSNHNKII